MVADADRQALLADAALRIAPLQDAVDLGTATEEETAKLLAWKRYRVELNRIEQQDGYPRTIGWPTPPA
ncbi:Tail fiber assembly protein [Orrella dioscoreae]|uniref:Tail fiber assembly protein n=2 Tax=Orrella dioscoreae TaxID=1851544 RepID=A0A1C3K3A6_9BURK|nr:Tail fiber assembly protein [Orrella dioscoreae]SOE50872.1 Tail fiber assembly protein [Orrella dioscoreae]